MRTGVVIAADETAKNAVTSNETFSSAAPVTGGKVQYTAASPSAWTTTRPSRCLRPSTKAYPKTS